MISYAILVDGGFIKRKLGTAQQPMTADDLAAFIDRLKNHESLLGARLHRIYFYDATPLDEVVTKPLNGGQINLGQHPAAQRNRRLHHELQRMPFVALRMGELNFRGWQVSPKALPKEEDSVELTSSSLQSNIQQKGVDMRIGLDIAALTLKEHVDVIVLITGDSDFIPAMKFARKEGVQLFLSPLRHSIKEGMHEHADLVLDVI